MSPFSLTGVVAKLSCGYKDKIECSKELFWSGKMVAIDYFLMSMLLLALGSKLGFQYQE